jgi:hypothetical protein
MVYRDHYYYEESGDQGKHPNETLDSYISRKVQEWHSSKSELSVWEFASIPAIQYAAWVEDPEPFKTMKEFNNGCPWCNDDELCPGAHNFIDYLNATDEELKEVGLMRIPQANFVTCPTCGICKKCGKRFPDHSVNCDYNLDI